MVPETEIALVVSEENARSVSIDTCVEAALENCVPSENSTLALNVLVSPTKPVI